MRKFLIVFVISVLIVGGSTITAYAADCAKDTLVDHFGDWFGNLGKSESSKKKHIAIRKANRLAACAETKAKSAGKAV